MGSIRRTPATVTIAATATEEINDSVKTAFALCLSRCPLAMEIHIAPPMPNRKNSACMNSTTGSARLTAEKASSLISLATMMPSTKEAIKIDILLMIVGIRYSLNSIPSRIPLR